MSNDTRRRPVVLINPVSSGSELAPAFAKRDVPSIAVRLRPVGESGNVGFADQIRVEDFTDVLDNDSELVGKLKKLNPLAIIAGTEAGVPLADQLAAQLTSQLSNPLHLSQARMHKALMQEALQNAGLPTIRTLNTSSVDEVEAWLVENDLSESPLVLKPPASAGSDNVHHIPVGGNWKKIFQHILDTPAKLMERVNETVIVQEQVSGIEFAVDTVSTDGNHTLAHLIQYKKTSSGERETAFDYTEFVEFSSSQHSELLEYTYKALDALGIKWGAAHSEIMLTESGPRLIETGARMCGGPVIGFARAATGSSQVEKVIEAYLDGSFSSNTYDLKQTVMPVFLNAPTSGMLKNVEVFEQIKELKTHLATHIWKKNGDHVPRGVDFNSCMGIIALSGDRNSVFSDYNKVREVEALLVIDSGD